MIASLKIENFRGFEKLVLQDLRRFNILVGDSGSGKTALLEALFLAGGANPEIYMRMRPWRGLGAGAQVSGSRRSFEALFREVFFGFSTKRRVEISFVDTNAGERSVEVAYQSSEQYNLDLKTDTLNPWVIDPIAFTWTIDGKQYEGKVEVKDGRLSFTGFSQVYPIWLISSVATDPLYEYFSELSKRNSQEPVIEALRGAFPEIQTLTLESIAGQLVICASVTYLKEKIPIGLLSGGISKFFWILLAIANNENGVVLIDELENSLYFKSFRPMMETIVNFAETNHVQIIATTHSQELLCAIARTMEPQPERFTLIRSSRRSDGHIDMAHTLGSPAISVIEQGIEVR